jgi:hypothetical protein
MGRDREKEKKKERKKLAVSCTFNTKIKYHSTSKAIRFLSFQWHDTINKIYVAGYSISLFFLCIATFIFLYFR